MSKIKQTWRRTKRRAVCDYEEKDDNLLVKMTSIVNTLQSKFECMFSNISRKVFMTV